MSKVLLASLPWTTVAAPSMQLGTLVSVLEREDIMVEAKSFYFSFLELLLSQRSADFGLQDYVDIADISFLNGLGEWVFLVEPYASPDERRDETYWNVAGKHISPRLASAAKFARAHAAGFVEWVAQEIVRAEPDIVGFTSTFAQNVCSLAVAKRVKELRPRVATVFGGANVESGMGAALHAEFDWVDYVVRGEGEAALPALVRVVEGARVPSSVPGLCYREDGASVAMPFDMGAQTLMDSVPPPNYDEYFERLRSSKIRAMLEPLIHIPVESSRGCWWGEKHHCTFCGLNGQTMAYRSKNGDNFADEIIGLSRKYRRLLFHGVDNILDLKFFKSFLPRMQAARAEGLDFRFFFETKANLRKEQLQMMGKAGVYRFQPGIEALNTSILRRIDKGVTAIQNVRLLKWARELGMGVDWHLIYGFPGETVENWNEVHDMIPLISHFQPPRLIGLLLERFSPYFDDPDKYGIKMGEAASWYRSLYPLPPERVTELAYYFQYTARDTVSPETIARVQRRLDEIWNDETFVHSSFKYTVGPGFVEIKDRRVGLPAQDIVLSALPAHIFLICDNAVTPLEIEKWLASNEAPFEYSQEIILKILDELHSRRILFREGERWIALATARTPVDGPAAKPLWETSSVRPLAAV